jgi:predicted anti-sigma-YlaC factor YlaD
MVSNELTCKELVELVTDYLEGALAPTEHRRFEEHLAGCQGCRNYLQQMRETIRLTGKLTEEAIEPQAKEALLQVFRAWKSSGEV